MDDSVWGDPVLSASFADDGSLVVVGQTTDQVSGDTAIFTVTLTPGRVLTCVADGIDLAGFLAWSLR